MVKFRIKIDMCVYLCFVVCARTPGYCFSSHMMCRVFLCDRQPVGFWGGNTGVIQHWQAAHCHQWWHGFDCYGNNRWFEWLDNTLFPWNLVPLCMVQETEFSKLATNLTEMVLVAQWIECQFINQQRKFNLNEIFTQYSGLIIYDQLSNCDWLPLISIQNLAVGVLM